MEEKKLEELTKKYPAIFEGRTLPNGDVVPFHFECDNGWYDIIDVLCSNIQRENEMESYRLKREGEEYAPVIASQVKEKFGGLRFYVDGHNDRVSGMITMAESMSYRTCEVCGKPGRPRRYAWVQTHCEDHIDLDRLKSQ